MTKGREMIRVKEGGNVIFCAMDILKQANRMILFLNYKVQIESPLSFPQYLSGILDCPQTLASSSYLRHQEKPPSENHTMNKLQAWVIRTIKVGGENLRVLSPKHMSPPDTGAEQFKTEIVPGNFNSCVTCFEMWKFLLSQWLAWYRLFQEPRGV